MSVAQGPGGAGESAAQRRRRLVRVVAAATIGTALEWFDLLAYGFFAVIIAQVFFAQATPLAALLMALGTFGASYVSRPLGSLLLGSYADRHGRKKGLALTITLMAFGTGLIAVTPGVATIGVAAPIIIVVARLIQGLSAGGEFGTSTAFLVEHAPPDRRGLFASFQVAAAGGTAVIAALFGAVLNGLLSPDQLMNWGWRIPFVFGLTILPVALFIRRYVEETPSFTRLPHEQSPLRETLSENKRRLAFAVGFYVLLTAASFVIVIYLPTFAIRELGLPSSAAFVGTLIIGTVQVLACPLSGWVSDLYGRLRCLIVFGILLGAAAVPVFWWMTVAGTTSAFYGSCLMLGLAISAYQGPMPAALSEIFPASIRSTALSIANSLAVPLFGGFAPLIMAWAVGASGSKLVPGFYVAGAALVSIGCLLAYVPFAARSADRGKAASGAGASDDQR